MIPKKIYRSWYTQNFHYKIHKQMDKMNKLNPDYEQIIYTDEQVNDYINSNFSKEIINAFNKLNIMTARIDFWRYLILYQNGGIYLDIDSCINKKISSFLNNDDDALITAETNPGLFVQWALFFIKKHPILEIVIENVVKNIETNKFHNDIINLTGPGAFTEALSSIHKKYQKNELIWGELNENYDEKFLFNYGGKTFNYRIYGFDYNKKLTFKFKNSHYLYINKLHWQQELKNSKLIKF